MLTINLNPSKVHQVIIISPTCEKEKTNKSLLYFDCTLGYFGKWEQALSRSVKKLLYRQNHNSVSGRKTVVQAHGCPKSNTPRTAATSVYNAKAPQIHGAHKSFLNFPLPPTGLRSCACPALLPLFSHSTPGGYH